MTRPQHEVPPGALTVELRFGADVAVAAVVARRIAGHGQLGPTGAAQVAIVAAELAANAVRHGGGGAMHLWLSEERLHIVVWDCGRIHFAQECERLLRAAQPDADHGLGAVRRFMDHIEFVDGGGGGLCVRAWRRRAGAVAR